MTRSLATLVLAGGVVFTNLPVVAAGEPPEQQPTVQAQKELLATHSMELERKLHRPSAANFRGPAVGDIARRNRIRGQQREIEALIQRLEAGESVAPTEVERLLGTR